MKKKNSFQFQIVLKLWRYSRKATEIPLSVFYNRFQIKSIVSAIRIHLSPVHSVTLSLSSSGEINKYQKVSFLHDCAKPNLKFYHPFFLLYYFCYFFLSSCQALWYICNTRKPSPCSAVMWMILYSWEVLQVMPQKWPHLKQYGFSRNTQEKINRANALDSGQLIRMMKWVDIQISLTGLTSV